MSEGSSGGTTGRPGNAASVLPDIGIVVSCEVIVLRWYIAIASIPRINELMKRHIYEWKLRYIVVNAERTRRF
jgi:hypothetical protein